MFQRDAMAVIVCCVLAVMSVHSEVNQHTAYFWLDNRSIEIHYVIFIKQKIFPEDDPT